MFSIIPKTLETTDGLTFVAERQSRILGSVSWLILTRKKRVSHQQSKHERDALMQKVPAYFLCQKRLCGV